MQTTTPIIEICGLLIHTMPDAEANVTQALQQMAGVEVHHSTEGNRLIVTVEGDGSTLVMDTIDLCNQITGVISTTLTYQHAEPAA